MQRRIPPIVYIGHHPSGQLCLSGRARGRGARLQGAAPYILHKRGVIQLQSPLLPNLETLHRPHHQEEATPLLQVTPSNGCDILPLGEVIQSQDATWRTTKWALKLMNQGITYAPQTAIKSQVLADFITEWTEVQMPPAVVDQEYWAMYFDGSLMKKDAGVGLVFVSPLGVRMKYMVHLHFPSSNNVAEYEALINGLRIAIELGIRCLDVQGDS